MASKTPSRITVEVTETDIERAHKSDSYKCVVAQAVARTVPDATRIEVDTQSIRFTRANGERWLYLTPYAVQGYVIAFDAGDPIEPFSFQLRDPRRTARRLKTEAGLAIDRAQQRARRVTEGTTKAVVPSKKRVQDAVADDEAVKAVKAAYVGAQQTVTDDGGRRATPRVFKKKARAYGHRLLRINQEL